MERGLGAAICAAALACGDPSGGRGVVDLIDNTAWVQVDAVDDVFGDRPASITCPPGSTTIEVFAQYRETLDVDTDLCDYFTATQPLQADIRAGDTLVLEWYHFALTAPVLPAEAHVALAIDGVVVFEETIDIPAPISDFLRPQWIADADVAAGTPVDFHLHNHGDNSYGLLRFSAGPPREF